ncbi:hypothetical protein J6590_061121 [Homalodisca vitripennis]|nr:hypothetical protein J6590_061121 [Homalodisca vitripennis]
MADSLNFPPNVLQIGQNQKYPSPRVRSCEVGPQVGLGRVKTGKVRRKAGENNAETSPTGNPVPRQTEDKITRFPFGSSQWELNEGTEEFCAVFEVNTEYQWGKVNENVPGPVIACANDESPSRIPAAYPELPRHCV